MEHILRTNIARMQQKQEESDKDLLDLRTRLLAVEETNGRLKSRLLTAADELRNLAEVMPKSSTSMRLMRLARDLDGREDHHNHNVSTPNGTKFSDYRSFRLSTTQPSDHAVPASRSRKGSVSRSAATATAGATGSLSMRSYAGGCLGQLPPSDPSPFPTSSSSESKGFAASTRPPRPPPGPIKHKVASMTSGGVTAAPTVTATSTTHRVNGDTGSSFQELPPAPPPRRRPSLMVSSTQEDCRGRNHNQLNYQCASQPYQLASSRLRADSQDKAADLKFRIHSRRTSFARCTSMQDDGENMMPNGAEVFDYRVERPSRGLCRLRSQRGG